MAKRADYLTGVYQNGKFMPYNMYGEYRARLDSASNKEAVEAADKGEAIHGSYKDGNFRPAEGRTRAGYMSKISLPSGQVLRYNFRGEIFDTSGKALGRLDSDGRLRYLTERRPSKGKHPRDHSREGTLKEYETHTRLGTSAGARDFYKTNEITNLANWLIKSNRVLGKLGAERRGFQISQDIKVYESEIPEFYRDRNGFPLFAGYNGTTDTGEKAVIIDRRLKPYEKLAALTHELAHAAQEHNPRTDAERKANEREAQTRAIKQLTKLYEDYEHLQHSVRGSEDRAFFNVNNITKRNITKAIGLLKDIRGYFGVNDKDLEEHTSTFRRVAHDLEGMVGSFIGFFGIIAGLFFLSSNLTGFAIANLTQGSSNWIGAVLIISGLACGFFWMRNKKRKK